MCSDLEFDGVLAWLGGLLYSCSCEDIVSPVISSENMGIGAAQFVASLSLVILSY